MNCWPQGAGACGGCCTWGGCSGAPSCRNGATAGLPPAMASPAWGWLLVIGCCKISPVPPVKLSQVTASICGLNSTPPSLAPLSAVCHQQHRWELPLGIHLALKFPSNHGLLRLRWRQTQRAQHMRLVSGWISMEMAISGCLSLWLTAPCGQSPCSAGPYLTFLPLHAVAYLGFYVLETAAVTASLILEAVFLYCIFVPLFEKYW